MDNVSYDTHYDAIIIGSGMGGLTAAALLSQVMKYRVLVLEQHFQLGGFTHSFSRKSYTWDVGLHYVGRMEPGSPFRRLFDFITQQRVTWTKMQEPFEVFCYPGLRFPVHSLTYRDDLIRLFPQERANLKRYFRHIQLVPKLILINFLPRWIQTTLHFIFRKIFSLTLDQALNQYFKNDQLKSLLASQWGDYGLPPKEASFVFHMAVAEHYLAGGYYPTGGAGHIAQEVQSTVEAYKGLMLTSMPVKKILLKDGRASGVECEKGCFFAREIYSNAGASNTFLKLLPDLGLSSQSDLKTVKAGLSSVTLYLGLKSSPIQLGIHGQNFWIYDQFQHNAIYERKHELLKGIVHHCYVSFPSLKNPDAQKHTAEVLAFIDFDDFKKWEGTSWRRRGPEYQALKEKITQALLDFVEKEIPGLSNLVDYTELSTPLSVEHFSKHPNGQIYGFPVTPDRHFKTYLKPKTPIKGLYLVGADAGGFGIVGSMIGGLLAVCSRHGYLKVLSALYKVIK